MQHSILICGDRKLDLTLPQVMGILNVTPDSFSDGGKYRAGDGSGVFFISVDKALSAAESMLKDGAAVIDVGGESTRPGAVPVSRQEELDRVIPVVEALTSRLGAIVSVDTSDPVVITEAARKGAAIVNDIRALQREGALQAAVNEGLGVCVMHMQGEPQNMQESPTYADAVTEVFAFLQQRVAACLQAGIPQEKILIDPGFGFGKTLQQNYALLRNLDRFRQIGVPLLVGLSRKSMIGRVVDKPTAERMAGSLAAAFFAVTAGARLIRTHDVAETVDAMKVYVALQTET